MSERGLPIKATFKTRHGFSKNMPLEELREVICLPFIKPCGVARPIDADTQLIDSTQCYQATFQLVRTKTVKQNNGLEHIVAVYEETP
jgi:hypothetical protein